MKFFLKLFTLVFCLVFLFPENTFAFSNVQSFTANISFNSSCNPKVVYSLSLAPSSMTSGNTFHISVGVQGAQTLEDYPIVVPLNGNISNATTSLTNTIISANTSYDVKILESTSSGYPWSHVASTTVQPSGSNCLGQASGNDNNQSSSSSSNSNTGSTSFSIDIENPISVNSIPQLIQKVLEFLIKIGIPLLVVMIVYSGFLYLFARGNPGKIGSAHTMLKYTLIGGAILLASWAIAELIHSTLIDITALIIQYFV